MRIVLLLMVVLAIGVAAKLLLKSSAPVVAPQASQPAAAPASRESLERLGRDVQALTDDATERARRAEEASR